VGEETLRGEESAHVPEGEAEDVPESVAQHRGSWARLLRRIQEVDPLTCPRCGNELKVVAVITGPAVVGTAFGAVLTEATKLTGDLSGSGTGLVVGADGITIDLNGHTLTQTAGSGFGIDNTGGYDGITIKNGCTEVFEEAVRAEGVEDLTLRDLEIEGAEGPSGTTAAIHVLGGEELWIRLGCMRKIEGG
jgi:hypothetical protein